VRQVADFKTSSWIRKKWAEKPEVILAGAALALSILTTIGGGVWGYFTWVEADKRVESQASTQWQQEIDTEIKELFLLDTPQQPYSENAARAAASRRTVLLQRIEDTLHYGASQRYKQPTELLSIVASSYANAGYYDLAIGYWKKVADATDVSLPLRVPAALSLRGIALEVSSDDPLNTSTERRLRQLIVLMKDDELAKSSLLYDWAGIEIAARRFSHAIDLLREASVLAVSSPCRSESRKRIRSDIATSACSIEEREPEGTSGVLKVLYSIRPDNKSWCPGDKSLVPSRTAEAQPQVNCTFIRKALSEEETTAQDTGHP